MRKGLRLAVMAAALLLPAAAPAIDLLFNAQLASAAVGVGGISYRVEMHGESLEVFRGFQTRTVVGGRVLEFAVGPRIGRLALLAGLVGADQFMPSSDEPLYSVAQPGFWVAQATGPDSGPGTGVIYASLRGFPGAVAHQTVYSAAVGGALTLKAITPGVELLYRTGGGYQSREWIHELGLHFRLGLGGWYQLHLGR